MDYYYSYAVNGVITEKSSAPFPEGTRQASSLTDYDLSNYDVIIGQVKEGKITAASVSPKPVAELIENIRAVQSENAELKAQLEAVRTGLEGGLSNA